MDTSKKLHFARLMPAWDNQLVGLTEGIISNGYLEEDDLDKLHIWLSAAEAALTHPLFEPFLRRVAEAFRDETAEESARHNMAQLLNTLIENDFQLDEVLHIDALPLNDPMPKVEFTGKRFCFSGTFVYGPRIQCEDAVIIRGAKVGALSGQTDYVVIGEYATENWAQSSYGSKIMKATELRATGKPIAIISESHWRKFL